MASTLAESAASEHKDHTERDVLAESIRLENKFPHLANYHSKKRICGTTDCFTADLRGKAILDYDCGRVEISMKHLANGVEKVAAIYI